MDKIFEAWLVSVVDNETPLADKTIRAANIDAAVAEAEEWAQTECQVTGPALLIVKCPGEPGSVYSKRFEPLRP